MSSVYKRNRQETELQFMVLAVDLQCELTKYMVKEKFVPKKWRLLIGQDMIKKVDELVDNVTAANSIFPMTEEQMQKRRNLQEDAICNCYQLHHKIVRMEKCIQTVTAESLANIIELLSKEVITLKRWKKTDKIKVQEHVQE